MGAMQATASAARCVLDGPEHSAGIVGRRGRTPGGGALLTDLPPLSHSRIETLDASGIPTILLVDQDGRSIPAWRQFVEEHRLGIGSQRSYARSLGLFLDFLRADAGRFVPKAERHKLFQAFADALVWGTITDGADPTGLWWLPRSAAAARRAEAQTAIWNDWRSAATLCR
ncbi:MAG TPA: hypothetical protein VMU78_08330 [Methylocella sp.]|nr:hypothetical protein [Methylocella sp.]